MNDTCVVTNLRSIYAVNLVRRVTIGVSFSGRWLAPCSSVSGVPGVIDRHSQLVGYWAMNGSNHSLTFQQHIRALKGARAYHLQSYYLERTFKLLRAHEIFLIVSLKTPPHSQRRAHFRRGILHALFMICCHALVFTSVFNLTFRLRKVDSITRR